MSLGGVLERSGSSPRGRGKRSGRTPRERRKRLIPAWAGKTTQRQSTARPSPAHPRVGGENEFDTQTNAHAWGSSPRGRGKRVVGESARRAVRLIPACAGKTSVRSPSSRDSWAHPRVGGENAGDVLDGLGGRGSSPRGRGKLSVRAFAKQVGRLIPAWAGKTGTGDLVSHVCPAHPRVGGENAYQSRARDIFKGSSPRGRGKQLTSWRLRLTLRLIPAWAGKTPVNKH